MSLLSTLKFIADHPLNRTQKVDSFLRFAKWQIASRLVPGEIAFDWVNGSKFLVRAGETGLTGNVYTGLHEFSDMAFLLHFLRAEDLFVDVGANVGSYTILACAAVGAGGIAFEPVPSTYERLAANMHLNRLADRVTCINKGVGARQATLTFTRDEDTVNHALADGEQCENPVEVEVVSLDMALNGRLPALVKIDVEGYESAVLEGAEETLRQQSLHSVIMELNGSGARYGVDEARLLELMLDCGFAPYSYEPLERKLFNLGGKNSNAGNTLFIRNEAFVAERLKSAPKVSILGRSF